MQLFQLNHCELRDDLTAVVDIEMAHVLCNKEEQVPDGSADSFVIGWLWKMQIQVWTVGNSTVVTRIVGLSASDGAHRTIGQPMRLSTS